MAFKHCICSCINDILKRFLISVLMFKKFQLCFLPIKKESLENLTLLRHIGKNIIKNETDRPCQFFLIRLVGINKQIGRQSLGFDHQM